MTKAGQNLFRILSVQPTTEFGFAGLAGATLAVSSL